MAKEAGKLCELVTSLCIFMSVIYMMTLPIFAAPPKNLDSGANMVNYGVLLDAGSSSTKLKIYRWDSSVSDSLVPYIDLMTDVRFETGLGNYEHDAEGLAQYISNILSRAKQDVPNQRYAKTPIFLMATAGLRFLSAANAITFLDKTRAVMADKTINPFLYKPSNVAILSGEEEGVYSWIAANYLLGFFNKYRHENESIGILEMGGGSTQIAFIPKSPLFSEEYQVIVAGRSFQLYVQSYLLYGSNSIKVKVGHELVQRYPDQDEVDNPCMLRGDRQEVQLEDGQLLSQRGTGSPTLCLELLREMLRPFTGIHCQPKPCGIGAVHQPSVENIQFVATQAFTYTPKTLKAVGDDEVLHIDRLEQAAIKHCDRSLQQAFNESGSNANHASGDCLMGLYIPSLLTIPYGFSRSTSNIKLTSRIGNGTIDWALGAMLVELSNSFGSASSQITVTCRSDSQSAVTAKTEHIKGNKSMSAYSGTTPTVLCFIALFVTLLNNLRLDLFL